MTGDIWNVFFCARELAEAGWTDPIAQINHTCTVRQGTIRGMHFQHPPHAEKKLVMCQKGRVFDVAIDIRKDSSTFLKWHGEFLSPDDANALLIPEGFAHVFQALTPDVEMLYFHSEFYAPESEAGIRYNDPSVGIAKTHFPCICGNLDNRPIQGTIKRRILSCLSHTLLNQATVKRSVYQKNLI